MKIADNPFNPNTVVVPTLFAGRAVQTDHILRRLSRVQNSMTSSFVIYGDRGIGKTALSRLIAFIAKENSPDLYNLNFATSYYTVEVNQSLKDVLQASMNSITDNLPTKSLDRLKKQLGGLFQDGKFKFGAFGASIELGKPETAVESQFFRDQITSSLSNIISASVEPEDGQFGGILIIIDEIQNIKNFKNVAHIFRGIINTLDFNNKGYFSFILVGNSEMVDDFFETDISARRVFDLVELKVMPSSESKELLTKGFKEANLDYDKNSLDKYVEVAGGYPHALQTLGYNLVEVDQDQNIGQDDWEKAIITTANQLQIKDFNQLYSFSKKPKIKDSIVDVLAVANGTKVYKNILVKVMGRGIYPKLSDLIKKGIIKENRTTGELKLQTELFKIAVSFHLQANNLAQNAKQKVEQLKELSQNK